MTDHRTLSRHQIELLAARGDVIAPYVAAAAKLQEPEHRPGRNESDRAHNQTAAKMKAWRREDEAAAKQRAKILANLGLAPKRSASPTVSWMSALQALRAGVNPTDAAILTKLMPAKSWGGLLD